MTQELKLSDLPPLAFVSDSDRSPEREILDDSHDWDTLILKEISKITFRYEIGEKLGSGGTADVFRALDTRLGRPVALKRFKAEAIEKESPAESDFHSELESVSQINHPNVVRAFDLDDDEQGPFLVFELLAGQNLEEHMQESELSPETAREFVLQALEALCAVHDRGIFHLDLKPSNFMVSPTANGCPHFTLIDFGRACDHSREKERRAAKDKKSLRGSIHYMAPEQFTQAPCDKRTDLYSLGVIAYELFTGIRAFDGDNAVQVMSAHLTNRFEPIAEIQPQLPDGIVYWIMAMISLDPAARFQNAQEAMRSFLALTDVTPNVQNIAPPSMEKRFA